MINLSILLNKHKASNQASFINKTIYPKISFSSYNPIDTIIVIHTNKVIYLIKTDCK